MKPPDDERPSGDRTIARLLVRAIEAAHGRVELASRLRSWSRTPDARVLSERREAGAREARRLIEIYDSAAVERRPHVWLTYHLYYKAPDWIGPAVAQALSIPYVVVEASHAAKRDRDEWAPWQQDVRFALTAADAVLSFTERDRIGIAQHVGLSTDLVDFSPFLDLEAHADDRASARASLNVRAAPRLVTVAMMRPGAKRASYELLADALSELTHEAWTIDIVGDGTERGAVEGMFARFQQGRVRFHGACAPEKVAAILAGADLYTWPGFEEAFGMAYLEAQAASVPVVALRTAGVPAVVVDGVGGVLVERASAEAYAAAICSLLRDPNRREALARSAREIVVQRHSLDAAACALGGVFERVIARRRVG
ncbi:MAG: glycosyltransferase family 4 protein [Hyphomicrobiaceae bacterium]